MRRHGTITDRLRGLLHWLLITALVGAAVFVVGRHFIEAHLDEQIRLHVERALRAQYPTVDIRLRSAHRLAGCGIELRGLTIAVPNAASGYRELLYVDELQAACNADLTDLLAGTPTVKRLTMRRLKVHATRYRDGKWNLESLLSGASNGATLPQIVIEDSVVELRDLSKPQAAPWMFRDISIHAEPVTRDDGKEVIRLKGSVLGDHFQRLAFTGWVGRAGTPIAIGGTVEGLEASPRMLDALPADVAQYASVLQTLRARAQLSFQVTRTAAPTGQWRWVVAGPISEGRIDDPRLPYPLTGVAAEVYCDNQRLALRQVTARSGASRLKLSLDCTDYLTPQRRVSLVASVEQLSLDRRLYQVLPQHLQASWKKFDPAGTIDATLRLTYQNGKLNPELHVTCRDTEFAYYKFPYRLRHAQGAVHLVNDTVTLEQFTAKAAGQTVYFTGRFVHPGPAAVGRMSVRSAGPLPVDEALIAAMTPSGQAVVRSMHPTGKITVHSAEFYRAAGESVAHSELEIELNDCTVEFERFPYPIQKVTGTMFAHDRQWTYQKLCGYHDGAYIQANGKWNPAPVDQTGGELTMNFQCYDVPLDDALRKAVGAMNPEAEQFWASVRPRGTVDHLSATVYFDAQRRRTSIEMTAEKWPPGQNLDGRSITVQPTWLPLRMEDVTGSIWFADGRFELRNLRAAHGDSAIQLKGHGATVRGGPWDVTLDRLIADRFQLDDELIEALPQPMRPALRGLKLRGMMNLDGSMWLRGGEGLALTSGWDVAIDIEDGRMDNSLALQHIHGGLQLTGNKWPDRFASHGELKVDSLICRNVQVTQLQGPVWMDSRQLILGRGADPAQQGRLPRQVTAQMWGGTVAADGRVAFEDANAFVVDATLANASIAELARSFGTSHGAVSGRAFSSLHLAGNQAGTHTWRGAGQLRLVDADIYELPVMVAMLSVLSLRQPDTTAFTRSDVDFRLNGDQVYLDKIDFLGDAISLKGSGWMDLNRQIHLNFYALVGRQEFQVPLVSAILAEASRNILAIDVTGTVDRPKVTRKPLPELDETLQRLFPEAAPAQRTVVRGLPSIGWKLPAIGNRTR